jgi:tRNA pseudouridine55 synthase
MADLLHLLDKPEGWTSHDVVARMRRVLGERRIGHAGTLDPFATGLLLVAEGRATALLGCLSLLPKRYRARARLGIATDTQDRTGVPIRTSRDLPAESEIEAQVERLRGLTRQRPPLYSAVKVRGERLYLAARRGETPEPEERAIRIYHLTAKYGALPDLELDLTVSRGTYVRTLAHDLGEALGCGAHLVSLRRIASGPFLVDDALSPEPTLGTEEPEFRARAKPPADAIAHLPRATLTHEESSKLRHGRAPILAPARIEPAPLVYPVPPDETRWPLALFTPEGELLALAEAPGAPGPSAATEAGASSAARPVSLLRVFP